MKDSQISPAGVQPMTDAGLVGSTVQHFVEDFISQAEQGLKNKGYSSCTEGEKHLVIELNATEQAELGGGLKVHIFSLGAKKTDSHIQKMTIFAKKIDEDIQQAEKKAKIAEAEARVAIAKMQKEAGFVIH